MSVQTSKYRKFMRPWELHKPYCADVRFEDLVTDYVVPFSEEAENASNAKAEDAHSKGKK